MRLRPFMTASALAVVATCGGAGVASAETVHVNLANQDVVADDGACSLREAINRSNGAPADSFRGCTTSAEPAGSTVIRLDADPAVGPARYPIASVDEDDENATGDFDIRADVSIVGEGPAISWIDGARLDRVLDIATAVTVRITGVTVLNGQAPHGRLPGERGQSGGGIRSAGTLTLTDSVVRNSATGRGGYGAGGGRGGDAGDGGGIWSSGPLTLVNTTVTHNRANDGGGAGSADHRGAIGGAGGWAGGVAVDDTLTMRNSTISDNAAGVGGAGGTTRAGVAGDGRAAGGAGGVYADGSVTIVDSIITGNTAGAGGLGGDVTDTGTPGHGGAGGLGGGLVLNSTTADVATITSSSITGNAAGDGGAGGIQRTGAGGRGGEGGSGGGLLLTGGGTLAITGSTVADNASGDGNGGGGGGDGGDGGGLLIANGDVRIAASTLNGNTAGSGASSPAEPMPRGGNGGAVYFSGSSLSIVNSTLSGNAAGRGGDSTSVGFQAGSGGSGGGIYAYQETVSVTSSTIASNTAGSGGAGALPGPAGAAGGISGPVAVRTTIMALNDGSGCDGGIVDGGHNLDFPASACPGIDGDPHLGALTGNGGPTQSRALGAGSAALDQVPATGGCQPTDQRGVARPKDGACDIGAFEADPIPVSPRPVTPAGPDVDGRDHVAPRLTRYRLRKRIASYVVSEAGTATFTVKRVRRGRKTAIGSFSRRSAKGANRFRFAGRVRGKALEPGRYELVLVAKDAAGNRSRPKAVSFRVVK